MIASVLPDSLPGELYLLQHAFVDQGSLAKHLLIWFTTTRISGIAHHSKWHEIIICAIRDEEVWTEETLPSCGLFHVWAFLDDEHLLLASTEGAVTQHEPTFW